MRPGPAIAASILGLTACAVIAADPAADIAFQHEVPEGCTEIDTSSQWSCRLVLDNQIREILRLHAFAVIYDCPCESDEVWNYAFDVLQTQVIHYLPGGTSVDILAMDPVPGAGACIGFSYDLATAADATYPTSNTMRGQTCAVRHPGGQRVYTGTLAVESVRPRGTEPTQAWRDLGDSVLASMAFGEN